MSTRAKRRYVAPGRQEAAEATRARILKAAKWLFSRRGIDRVTIADIAKRADVGGSTVYALFASKAGLLRALMQATLLGPRFEAARAQLDDVGDPVHLVALSAAVARAIYESEAQELGLLRGVSAFSPELRKLEAEFERIRSDLQRARVEALFAAGRGRRGLDVDRARQILWMYTSRDVYRMLVHDSGWSPDAFQAWLARTLVDALVEPVP